MRPPCSAWTPHAQQIAAGSGKVGQVVRIEADAAFLDGGAGQVAAPGHVPLAPESIDLAVSLLSLQDENDIPGMLIQIRRALRPDGLFLGAMAGARHAGTNCAKACSRPKPRCPAAPVRACIPFTDVRDVGGLLQRAGFALPVADVET